jgi:hypothetical protein
MNSNSLKKLFFATSMLSLSSMLFIYADYATKTVNIGTYIVGTLMFLPFIIGPLWIIKAAKKQVA